MRIYRNCFLCLCFSFLYPPLLAQQEPLSSLWWKNISVINPAYSGLEYKHFTNIQGRDQWQSIEDNPQTLWASYDMRADFLHGGLGMNYERDRIGLFTSNKILLNYNYQFSFNEKHKLSIGLALGTKILSIDYSKFINDNPAIDPAIPPDKREHENKPVLNLGMAYNSDQFYVGFSMTNLTEPTYEFDEFVSFNYKAKAISHFYLTSSYNIKATDNFDVQPQFIYRGVDSNDDNSFDLNLRTIYKETYWIGLTYRQEDWLALMAGVDILKKFQIAYSYDVYDQGNTSFDFGPTHELAMSFFIKQ